MNKDVLGKILNNHKLWLKTNEEEGERADLQRADLQRADLQGADLQGVDLDYSSLPLSCKGLNIHIDDRLAIQQLYHLVRNVQFSKNTSSEMKELCKLKSIVEKANEFHRVEECGKIEIDHPTEKGGTK